MRVVDLDRALSSTKSTFAGRRWLDLAQPRLLAGVGIEAASDGTTLANRLTKIFLLLVVDFEMLVFVLVLARVGEIKSHNLND